MTHEALTHEALKHELQHRLVELQGRLSSIKRDVSQAHSVDSGEQAQERENDEVVDAIGNETVASIGVIQAALERFENGTYGVCASCGEAIGQARLETIPEATRCVNCAR